MSATAVRLLTPVPGAADSDAPFGLGDASYGVERTERIALLRSRPRPAPFGLRDASYGVERTVRIALLRARGSDVLGREGAAWTPRRPDFAPIQALTWPMLPKSAAASRIDIPRSAALLSSVVVAGGCTTLLSTAGLANVDAVVRLSMGLPLMLIAAVVGVARIFAWAPGVADDWRGWFGYLTCAPFAALVFATAAVPTLVLPPWLAAIAGTAPALPLVWSAVAPGRLRAKVRPHPDAHGVRGARIATAALALIAYSVVRPDYGTVVSVVLLVALTVGALGARGVADAGHTWGLAQWTALVWGCLVVWGTVAVSSWTPWLDSTWAHVAIAVAAALPLGLATRRTASRWRRKATTR